MSRFSFEAELWLHHGDAGWHFVTLPEDVSDDIADETEGQRRGFGSVRVRVSVGATIWDTSVFPDTKRGAYVLPVKQAVRSSEGLVLGDVVAVSLELIDGRGALSRQPRR